MTSRIKWAGELNGSHLTSMLRFGAIDVGTSISLFLLARPVLCCIDNLSLLIERLTTWPKYISFLVLLSDKVFSNEGGNCTASNELATPVKYRKEYNTIDLINISPSHLSFSKGFILLARSPSLALIKIRKAHAQHCPLGQCSNALKGNIANSACNH
jgi:hypothetical protein